METDGQTMAVRSTMMGLRSRTVACSKVKNGERRA
jgi:hypothetical protein